MLIHNDDMRMHPFPLGLVPVYQEPLDMGGLDAEAWVLVPASYRVTDNIEKAIEECVDNCIAWIQGLTGLTEYRA